MISWQFQRRIEGYSCSSTVGSIWGRRRRIRKMSMGPDSPLLLVNRFIKFQLAQINLFKIFNLSFVWILSYRSENEARWIVNSSRTTVRIVLLLVKMFSLVGPIFKHILRKSFHVLSCKNLRTVISGMAKKMEGYKVSKHVLLFWFATRTDYDQAWGNRKSIFNQFSFHCTILSSIQGYFEIEWVLQFPTSSK